MLTMVKLPFACVIVALWLVACCGRIGYHRICLDLNSAFDWVSRGGGRFSGRRVGHVFTSAKRERKRVNKWMLRDREE